MESKNEFINFDDFEKVDLRIAEITDVLPIEGSEKLLKLRVRLGEEERQILAGISKFYSIEELKNKKVVVVANLEPRMMFGEESRGMVLAAKDENGLSVIVLDRDIASGTKLS
ncbi:MAG: methionine--tRNA ligase subunit beta [Candidatus Pacebacteria bacterium]|nr:methionine--tRNA ligase subunit beta [Candidatus Paceibacterota bacterium]